MDSAVLGGMANPGGGKIVFVVMDGLGGLPNSDGKTELEAAHTPHLDELARRGICGLLDPVDVGITPGSGPAHFALFGYDPYENNVGRGLLEGAGINFPMQEEDLLVRVNFASLDAGGAVSDRRAGRIDTATNARICQKLQDGVRIAAGKLQLFFEPVRDHRALLVLRGKNLQAEIVETDPQKTGIEPLPPRALNATAEHSALVLEEIIAQSRRLLADEEKVHIPLLRGYAKYRRYLSMQERYKLRPLAIAYYPMYQGIARLLGMDIAKGVKNLGEGINVLEAFFGNYDFFFLHAKETDSRGEDSNFVAKMEMIERVDAFIPRIMALKPDVIVVTGDHSTPAVMGGHSWHPVPALLYAEHCRPDLVNRFGERDCLGGAIGMMPMKKLLVLALANAGRLRKFGA